VSHIRPRVMAEVAPVRLSDDTHRAIKSYAQAYDMPMHHVINMMLSCFQTMDEGLRGQWVDEYKSTARTRIRRGRTASVSDRADS
jgi:hypothetical protein